MITPVRCPNCGKHYIPDLGERKRYDMNIQQEFPNATSIQREQLMTGLCSDQCWQEFLGPEPEEDFCEGCTADCTFCPQADGESAE